jgi:hypothetical protein
MSLADGILGWADAGHPLVTPASVACHASTTVVAGAATVNCG